MQSDWNLPTAPVQLTTKVESSPADLRQTPDWQSSNAGFEGHVERIPSRSRSHAFFVKHFSEKKVLGRRER
ncbi:hypothetical protein, partial [Pseudomonas aeruginosa]|uniref:hypothetical protein n=1 Tax=Pseudomonas aeruginosa TaxID=287 RepID=UPI001F245F72